MALQFTLIVFNIYSLVTSVFPGEVVKSRAPLPLSILVAKFPIHCNASPVRVVQFPYALSTLWITMIMSGPE